MSSTRRIIEKPKRKAVRYRKHWVLERRTEPPSVPEFSLRSFVSLRGKRRILSIVDRVETVEGFDKAYRQVVGMRQELRRLNVQLRRTTISAGSKRGLVKKREQLKFVIDVQTKSLMRFLKEKNKTYAVDFHVMTNAYELYPPEDVYRKFKGEVRRHAVGRVLELGCEVKSYVDQGSRVSEVVGVDRSRLALTLYPYDKRLLLDLETVSRNNPLPFETGSVNTVVFPLSFSALKRTDSLLREINRVLSENGNLIVLETPTFEGHPVQDRKIIQTISSQKFRFLANESKSFMPKGQTDANLAHKVIVFQK